MNNKGFTLVEALAVIVLLGLVLSIGGYSGAKNIKNWKEESLKIFKESIKSGMINYYNECKHLSTSDAICKKDKGDDSEEKISVISSNTLSTTIGALAEYGFIENQGNDEDTGSLIIKNPVNEEEDLTNCKVSITYYTDKHNVEKEKQTFSDVTYDSNTCGSLGN